MSIRERALHRSLRSRCRRKRLIQPILEGLENRLVLSTLPGVVAPTYVLYHPPGPGGAGGTAGSLTPYGTAIPAAAAFSPQQLQAAYGVNDIYLGGIKGDGANQTIAIVDAYDNPAFVDSSDTAAFATSDLAEFDAYYGLPNPPSFTKVNQEGDSSPLPGTDPEGAGTLNWEVEEALDVEWRTPWPPWQTSSSSKPTIRTICTSQRRRPPLWRRSSR